MVARDFSTRRDRSPMKQQQSRREAIENIQRALEKGGAFEYIERALKDDEIDRTEAYALLGFQERRNFPQHSTEHTRERLSELGSASDQSHDTKYGATREYSVSPQRSEPISDAGYIHSDELYTSDVSVHTRPSNGRRVFRPTRQRGRPSIPQDSTRVPRTFSPVPTPPKQTVLDIQSEGSSEQSVRRGQFKSFRIDDEEQVVEFLLSRLKRMQQLADKKIAKAWIKGICPKKQAKFPYSNKKRREETGVEVNVPQWWPELSDCKFTEPDHIKREERMMLCLHLLRLRPTPAQLYEWNNRDTEPNKTHQTVGWTAFLKELAGPEIFDDLPKEPAQKVKQRRELMLQMYELAQMEEDYINDARDGDNLFSYEEDEEDRKANACSSAKRSRRPSVASDADDVESRAGSVPAKRIRRESSADVQPAVERRVSDTKPAPERLSVSLAHHHSVPGQVQCKQPSKRILSPAPELNMECTRQNTPMEDSLSAKPQTDMKFMWQQYDQAPGQWVDHGAPVFYAQQFPAPDPYQIQNAPSNFPGRQDYELPRFPQQAQVPQQQVQINNVHHIPQPKFQALPSAPIYPPSTMAPSSTTMFSHQPVDKANVQFDPNYIPGPEYHMPASQYFMPCQGDPTVADFRPPVALPYQQDSQNMVHHGLPYAHLGQWRQCQ